MKPSIDWSTVKEKYKYLAVDKDGTAFLYSQKPALDLEWDIWDSVAACSPVKLNQTYSPGDCDWTNSLIKR